MGAVFHGIAASIDFVVFTLYVTSIGLLAENFNADHDKRPLVRSLSDFRAAHGLETRESLTNRLVSLLDALVIIQIILFFYSMLFSAWVAWRETKHRKEDLRMARGNEKNLVSNVTAA